MSLNPVSMQKPQPQQSTFAKLVQPVATLGGAVVGSLVPGPGTIAGASLGAAVGGAAGGVAKSIATNDPLGAGVSAVQGIGSADAMGRRLDDSPTPSTDATPPVLKDSQVPQAVDALGGQMAAMKRRQMGGI